MVQGYNPQQDTAEKMNSVGMALQNELYQDYLQQQAEEFARQKAIKELEAEDPNNTEGRDV